MFGLGFPEILMVLVIVLFVLGPEQLPEFTRTLGKTIWKIRHAADELKGELKLDSFDFEEEEEKDESKKDESAEQKSVSDKVDEPN